MSDPERVAAGRRARALGRDAEKREAKWLQAQGFCVEEKPRKARYLGPGKLITVPSDFFKRAERSGYDLVAIYEGYPSAFVGVQVTRTGFYNAKDPLLSHTGRNAAHANPPFAFPHPPFGVEDWIARVQSGVDVFPTLAHYVVSYRAVRNPERRWWQSV